MVIDQTRYSEWLFEKLLTIYLFLFIYLLILSVLLAIKKNGVNPSHTQVWPIYSCKQWVQTPRYYPLIQIMAGWDMHFFLKLFRFWHDFIIFLKLRTRFCYYYEDRYALVDTYTIHFSFFFAIAHSTFLITQNWIPKEFIWNMCSFLLIPTTFEEKKNFRYRRHSTLGMWTICKIRYKKVEIFYWKDQSN